MQSNVITEKKTQHTGPFDFGKIELHFPNGVIGFSNIQRFELSMIKNVLQIKGVNDPDLGFYALPIDPDVSILEQADIQQTCTVLNIEPSSLLILAFLSSHREEEKVVFAINLRAPIFIDVSRKQAWQYVFAHNKYPIRYEIGRV